MKEYNEGCKAYRRYKHFKNPYPQDSGEAFSYCMGWFDQRDFQAKKKRKAK